jgi:HAMP domain-containing protein
VRRGLRTQTVLVASLVLVIASVTVSSLFIVRNQMRQHVAEQLSADLANSMEMFRRLQSQRLAELRRENALLADLPSLKALMTTSDERTIADGAIEFWKVSDNDLFALVRRDGCVTVAYTRGAPATPKLRTDLSALIAMPDKHFLLSGERLFEFAVRPLYFGSEQSGTLLGYVVSGYAIDEGFVNQISQASGVDATFLSGKSVVASTLSHGRQELSEKDQLFAPTPENARSIMMGGEQYLVADEDLSVGASSPLHLVVLESLDQAEHAMRQINRLVFILGLLGIFVGSCLMLAISNAVTRPLELLAIGVRAFGTGDSEYKLPLNGTQEVRELSASFAKMRREIDETQRALLESERLATIGRMASSVSHDLRHYLAAV